MPESDDASFGADPKDTVGVPQAHLTELAEIVAEALNARRCVITIFREEQDVDEGRLATAIFGYTPASRWADVADCEYGEAQYRSTGMRDVLTQNKVREISPSLRKITGSNETMSSPVLRERKIIGVVHVDGPLDGNRFGSADLNLFSALVRLVSKAVKAAQAQKAAELYFTDVALTQAARKNVQGLVMASAEDPDRVVRIVAKAFYREMTRAGFDPKHVIRAASEIISELSKSVRGTRPK
ncbi:GAF domain-containing protein [Caballeronia sp. dw_19]|uniref:GAF domain-containing protein n=1 Tax=Caballeronia sp. dw_19 TaxID=2719791 RepID=UPI001BD43D10|nr:GAF domain-containing protein [Caballeronia sp. dw_19]